MGGRKYCSIHRPCLYPPSTLPLRRLMCNSAGLRVQPLAHLAERTEGFSGSDLNELCSQAATMPVHEAIAERER